MAKSHLVYAHEENQPGMQDQWKDFHLGNILLAVQRRMSQRFNGNAMKMKEVCTQKISDLLKVDVKQLNGTELEAFNNFSILLSLIPNVEEWNTQEKELTSKIFRAKAIGSEGQYLQLMQKHKKLREALIKLGSKVPPANY